MEPVESQGYLYHSRNVFPISTIGRTLNFNFVRRQALSEEIASQPECYKGKFSVLTCDIAKEEDIKETFSKIKSSFGSIAILINNAAAAEPITVQMSGTYLIFT